MSSDDSTSAPIALFFTPEFKRNLRQLAKRYLRIKSDIQPIIDLLEQGQLPGDRISGIDVEVYKI